MPTPRDRKRAVLVQEVAPRPPFEGVKKASAQTAVLTLVPAGQQKITAGQAFDFELEGALDVVVFYLDVPVDVDADFSINGSLVAQSTDRLGLVGSLQVGDYSRNAFLPIQRARLKGTNQHASEARDVRAWLVVIP